MTDLIPVIVPQVNPNELEAQLIELNAVNGTRVRKGDRKSVV